MISRLASVDKSVLPLFRLPISGIACCLGLCILLATMLFFPVAAIAAEEVVAPEAADNSATASGTGLVITDGRGKNVALPALPQRIVITGKAAFMVLDAVYLFPEVWPKVVGTGNGGQGMDSFLSAVDPDYAVKATLGREPGPEQIAACKPDVVLMKKASTENLGRSLEALGIPVVCVDFETPEEYERDLAIIGRLTGQEARAATLAAMIKERIQMVSSALSGLDDGKKPRVLMLYYSSRDGSISFNVPPTSWMQTLLVKMAGGQPLWEGIQLGQGWTKIGFEQIAAWDPDKIFVVSYFENSDKAVANLMADEHWQALRAVKSGNLLAFPGELLSWDQPDPRWVLGLTWLAGKMHPELFPELNMQSEFNRFFKEFYGVSDSIIEKVIRPTLHGNL